MVNVSGGWSNDVSPADWIAPTLHTFSVDTGSVVPSGFDAYCRIFHPVESGQPGRPTRRWADVAAENDRIVHPEMQFHMINRPAGTPSPSRYERGVGPSWGTIPSVVRTRLNSLLAPATTTPDRCWYCVWDGHGGIDDRGVSERVQLPGRSYLLYSGPLGAHGPVDSFGDSQAPNLWWPDDRVWIVITEIDYAWTYVGASSWWSRRFCQTVSSKLSPSTCRTSPSTTATPSTQHSIGGELAS